MLRKLPSEKSSAVRRSGQGGQVAIFIALIFQVLFVFFAMVINVGLLVHQKINLQNSVDLAAYYGASKQAENLNAIAHMNYQIRQAWKLLIFRYQQIGSAGDAQDHPYNNVPGSRGIRSDDDTQEYARANYFCYAYDPFSPYTGGQTYCNQKLMDLNNPASIKLPGASSIFGVLGGLAFFDATIRTITNQLIGQAMQACEGISGLNWFGLARFISGYKMDLANRKKSIYLLANGMSKTTDDLLDLDGDSVRAGIEKTIRKNLTPENRDNFNSSTLKVYNSLAHSSCGFVDKDAPPKWLVETNIFPTFYYVDTNCVSGAGASVDSLLKIINQPGPQGLPNYPNGYSAAINTLSNYIYEPDGNNLQQKIYKSALGFEKNPWCMAYIKVQAETTPNIPFSPIGKVTLRAKAFAKPFGGKVGPWYGKVWNSGAPRSDKGTLVDERVPERVGPGEFPNYAAANLVANLQPNYSRYIGDKLGTRSKLTTAHFGKAIFEMGPISYGWWDHLVQEDLEDASSAGDPLAWDTPGNKAPPMRNLEIAAVAPDNFDVNYYSIEPDFYRNYLTRLNARTDRGKLVFRGDLGARRTEPTLKNFSVKEQIAIANQTNNPPIDASKLTYLATQFYTLLNSWQGKDQEDYSIDSSRFGKCGTSSGPPDSNSSVIKENLGPESAAPGNCTDGGRVGYSVKLVDENHLLGQHVNLGGEGQSGQIINKPD